MLEISYWFYLFSTKNQAAILARHEVEEPGFEDRISYLVCCNLPNRGLAFAVQVPSNLGDDYRRIKGPQCLETGQLCIRFHHDLDGKMWDEPHV